MIWIEIIGPSGVGKSYWYDKFMQKHPEYEPKNLVLNQIYKSEDLTQLPLKIKFMFWVYKMNAYRISNHFKHKLFNYFLKGFQRKSKTIFTANDEVVIGKYLISIDSLNEPQIIVLKKIAYFHEKLIEFKFYEYYLKEDDIYIAEDGLMHLSSAFIPELQADKVLIFEKEFQKLMDQRIQRAKNKPTAFIEFLLNTEDLKNYIQAYYQLYNAKIKAISQNMKPNQVHSINLEQADVLKEMHAFIVDAKTN